MGWTWHHQASSLQLDIDRYTGLTLYSPYTLFRVKMIIIYIVGHQSSFNILHYIDLTAGKQT